MLDIKRVCDNLNAVEEALCSRSGNYSVKGLEAMSGRRREIIGCVERKKSEKNKASDLIAAKKRNKEDAGAEIELSKKLGDEIKALDAELLTVETNLRTALLNIPNIPHVSVPKGKDSDDNVVVREVGTPTRFDFESRPHWDIGASLGILDAATAAKITGARFTVYKGLGAKLERAITNYMLDLHTANGFLEIFPPFMVNRDSMTGTGQLPKFEEDAFALKNPDYFLVPTAEVPVTNMHRGEILDGKTLPIYYCAYTACFRAEAGSAGRDTRGLIRQHQFNKVELVKFSKAENSYEELEHLTAEAEAVLKGLGLPYRVVSLCTGDLGFSSSKTYDIEVWMPSYGRYVEISSCSNFEDFQARRMNIKYREDSGQTVLVHTLNGSGLAVGRTTAAILENFQNADGTVTVPEVLQKYMGTDRIQ